MEFFFLNAVMDRVCVFQIYVSLAGMLCVGLSLLVAYGTATAFGLIYSPIQSIMPFMLLGKSG
jgi:hypothetical protein